jgi:hypothetical protein
MVGASNSNAVSVINCPPATERFEPTGDKPNDVSDSFSLSAKTGDFSRQMGYAPTAILM